MRRFLVGVDIGGTKTDVLVVEGATIERGQARSPTVLTSPADMVAGIADTVHAALEQAGAESATVVGVGVGVPGQVDPDAGEVRLAVNLGLKSYPLGAALAQALAIPVRLENDIRVAALGAYHDVRRERPIHSLAYLGIGTGVAAGGILGGSLYRGVHGMAGEIGHIVMEEDGDPCRCGQRGCLEAMVSGPAIERQAVQAGIPQAEANLGALYRRAAQGDPRAQAIVHRVGRAVARAVQWLIMAYDVERVVLGGGIGGAGEALQDSVRREIERMRTQSELARTLLPEGSLEFLPAGFNPGTRGAIRIAAEAAEIPIVERRAP
ncbi:MAG: ROK family protein [Anaerolineales bacterium]